MRDRLLWAGVFTLMAMFAAMWYMQMSASLIADADVTGDVPEVSIEKWYFGPDEEWR